jgi:hypothetical protein
VPTSTAMRLVIVFMLIAIGAFFAAGATDGATLPVAVGFLGLFAAGGALVAEIDAEPGANRTASRRRRRPPRIDNYGRRMPLTTWEPRP